MSLFARIILSSKHAVVHIQTIGVNAERQTTHLPGWIPWELTLKRRYQLTWVPSGNTSCTTRGLRV